MAYIYKNMNPSKKIVGDCVVRAIALLENSDWATTYMELVVQGYNLNNMPSANEVWGSYLKHLGYSKYIIPNTCPDCYTVEEFAEDHKTGKYLLATTDHAVTVINGDYYDTWDSGQEVPIYYFTKEE